MDRMESGSDRGIVSRRLDSDQGAIRLWNVGFITCNYEGVSCKMYIYHKKIFWEKNKGVLPLRSFDTL